MAVQISTNLIALHPIYVKAAEPGAVELECGQSAFTTSDTTTTVRTQLTEIINAVLLPVDPTLTTTTSNDLLYTDGAISTNVVTITRGAAGKSGLTFWYAFIGRRYATS